MLMTEVREAETGTNGKTIMSITLCFQIHLSIQRTLSLRFTPSADAEAVQPTCRAPSFTVRAEDT